MHDYLLPVTGSLTGSLTSPALLSQTYPECDSQLFLRLRSEVELSTQLARVRISLERGGTRSGIPLEGGGTRSVISLEGDGTRSVPGHGARSPGRHLPAPGDGQPPPPEDAADGGQLRQVRGPVFSWLVLV